MVIDEIDIPGASISLSCWNARIDNIPEFFKKLSSESDAFALDPEIPGFHDCDSNKKLIRGFYSGIVPFEVEHLVEGITTKTLFKRIESTEFLLLENCMFTMGKSGPTKGLSNVLSATSGYGVSLMEFEFRQMSQLQDRLSQTKAIVLTNPKEKDVRRARLAGLIESYTEYNVIDPRNHGIESATGLVDSPLGPLTISVSRKGGLRLNVKRGFILTIECLLWLLSLIRDEEPPAALTNGGVSAAQIA